MKYIELTQGQKAIVDDEDFERVNAFKWYAAKCPNTFYVQRVEQPGGRKGKRTTIHLHRFIMETNSLVDHKDGNGLNNQKTNLRLCSRQQNNSNKRNMNKGKSIYKGVSWDSQSGKFIAQLKVNYKSLYIMKSNDDLLCAKYYDAVTRYHNKEFAKCNFDIQYIEPMSYKEAQIHFKNNKK